MVDAEERGTIARTQNRKSEAQMVDQEKVEAAIKLLLEGIGEDPTREGLLETPARVARSG